MKKILLLMLAVVAMVSSCTKSDLDDIRAEQARQAERLTALELWQQSVNGSIASLQGLVTALEKKDFVTTVTPLSDGTGYVINFQNSGAVTIKHGDKGATPIIGTKQDADGKYYWTLDGEWLLDNGAKIPTTGAKGDKGDKGDDGQTPYIGSNGNWWVGTADLGIKAQGDTGDDGQTPYIGSNGNWWIGKTDLGVKAQGDKGDDAVAPQVRINATSGEWEVSTDKGENWTTTGVKAQGDAIFAKDGVDNSNSGYVILTLADGTTKITLPRYKAFKIGTDSGNDAWGISSSSTTIPLSLPAGFKESDYTAIMAQVISNQGTGTDIKTRAATSPWSVTVNKPTFTNGTYNNDASVTVTLPNDAAEDEAAILEVTLVNSDGSKTTATRALKVVEWNGTTKTAPAVGDGSEANPYLISTGANLAYIAQQVNNGTTYEGKYIKLTNDINLNDKEWTPIGKDESHPFKGNFDGNGKAISGLKITVINGIAWADNFNYIGLFGYMDGGSIKYISVTGLIVPDQIESGQTHIGGIVGYLKSGSVSNLSATVTITTKTGMGLNNTDNVYVGGAIGKSNVSLASSVFSITPAISFGIDGAAYGYVGHNVGYCVDINVTVGVNNRYNASGDPTITISKRGAFTTLCINGEWKN